MKQHIIKTVPYQKGIILVNHYCPKQLNSKMNGWTAAYIVFHLRLTFLLVLSQLKHKESLLPLHFICSELCIYLCV